MTAAGFGYSCAVLLALVFVVAAVAKLRDRSVTAESFADLGLPYADGFAKVVPLVELAVASALVVIPFVGAVAALTTLAFFTTFLATRMRAGVTAPCSCFGQARREPLSPANLVGNAFLLLAALAAFAAPAPTTPTIIDLAAVAIAACVEIGIHALVRSRTVAVG